MAVLGHVAYLYFAVINNRRNCYLFMNGALPPKGPVSLKKLGSQFFVKVVDSSVGKLVSIIHLHNLNLRQKSLL